MRWLAVAGAVALIADLALLLSGYRVLIRERRVDPGEHYAVAEYGDLGRMAQASLVCRYFTGRSVLTKVFWHSPNGFLGTDECPFLDRGE